MKKPRKALFRGKPFRVYHGRSSDDKLGWCEPDKRQKWIWLATNQSPRSFLNTAIHEAIHAACPRMRERKVRRLADAIEPFLWAHGYRSE